MTDFNLASSRLRNQHLTHQTFERAVDIVRHLGAVQSQDYPGAKWAVGMRLLNATDDAIEQAFNDGAILRTHVMRPTWHFVAPEDIRWLLKLTAPRVKTINSHYQRRNELDEALLARTNDIIAEALQGGNALTRSELAAVLERAGVKVDGLRLGLIGMRAELDAVMCSGPRRGKQFTYALVDERAPEARDLERDEALAELTTRYFTSHGPATAQDFAWWSGLTLADVKAGLEMAKSRLDSERRDGVTYWFSNSPLATPPASDISETAFLLPAYDEYGVGYKDRKDLIEPGYTELATAGKLPPELFLPQLTLGPKIITGGKAIGSWKRTITKNEVRIDAYSSRPLTEPEAQALEREVDRYGRFLGLPATLESRVI